MQFIIDVTRVFRYRIEKKLMTGIDRVTIAYIRHYSPRGYALVRWCGRAWLLPKAESDIVFSWLTQEDVVINITYVLLRGIVKHVDLAHTSPVFLLNTGHVAPTHDDYRRLITRFGAKPIFFVHDLIPIEYPEYCFAGEDARHQEKIAFVLRHAQAIITNSQATYEALKSYHQDLPPSIVAWLASSFKHSEQTSRPFNKPYFVLNSTIEPRKNHLLILQIWRKLQQKYKENTPHLFVIGKRGWECEQVLDMLERSKALKNTVTELNQCTDDELKAYIQHCQAMLMPSFAEGFGLGLVEALTLKVPVIASDLPVFREIAQEIPEYADPLDGARWETLILEYADMDSALRASQLKRLQDYIPPSWEKHFETVDEFLHQV